MHSEYFLLSIPTHQFKGIKFCYSIIFLTNQSSIDGHLSWFWSIDESKKLDVIKVPFKKLMHTFQSLILCQEYIFVLYDFK